MRGERNLNTAIAVFLADKAFPMGPDTRLILMLALAAIVGRLAWDWMRPTWARYPATVVVLTVLALLEVPRV